MRYVSLQQTILLSICWYSHHHHHHAAAAADLLHAWHTYGLHTAYITTMQTSIFLCKLFIAFLMQ